MKKILLFLCGIAAGIINGFLGSGGGIVLIFAMSALVAMPEDTAAKSRFATAVASILPMSAISVYFYARSGALDIRSALPFLFPAAIGGVAGAAIMNKLSPKILKLVFSILMVWAGVRII